MRVRLEGEVIDIPEEAKDPDTYIEQYVASGKAKSLERTNPDVAIMLTKRFIEHQAWLDGGRKRK